MQSQIELSNMGFSEMDEMTESTGLGAIQSTSATSIQVIPPTSDASNQGTSLSEELVSNLVSSSGATPTVATNSMTNSSLLAMSTPTQSRFRSNKRSKQTANSPLKECMKAYFSARTSELSFNDDDADATFGKLVGKELSCIKDESVKMNLKKLITDSLFTAQLQSGQLVSYLPQSQVLQVLQQPAVLQHQQQQQQLLSVNDDGILQYAN